MKTLYVYSDESGVFDKFHHNSFVYAGIICIDQSDDSTITRKYRMAEKNIRKDPKYSQMPELKAFLLEAKHKRKLYRCVCSCWKFAIIINLKKLNRVDFTSKQAKQRFLDFAFKLGLKSVLEEMLKRGTVSPDEDLVIKISVDEHSNATNGKYNLEKSLYTEFAYGMYNPNFGDVPAILPQLKKLELRYCNSELVPLIRAADIIANRVLYEYRENEMKNLELDSTLVIKYYPAK